MKISYRKYIFSVFGPHIFTIILVKIWGDLSFVSVIIAFAIVLLFTEGRKFRVLVTDANKGRFGEILGEETAPART